MGFYSRHPANEASLAACSSRETRSKHARRLLIFQGNQLQLPGRFIYLRVDGKRCLADPDPALSPYYARLCRNELFLSRNLSRRCGRSWARRAVSRCRSSTGGYPGRRCLGGSFTAASTVSTGRTCDIFPNCTCCVLFFCFGEGI